MHVARSVYWKTPPKFVACLVQIFGLGVERMLHLAQKLALKGESEGPHAEAFLRARSVSPYAMIFILGRPLHPLRIFLPLGGRGVGRQPPGYEDFFFGPCGSAPR